MTISFFSFSVSLIIDGQEVKGTGEACASELYVKITSPYEDMMISASHIPYFARSYRSYVVAGGKELTSHGLQVATSLLEELFHTASKLSDHESEIREILSQYQRELFLAETDSMLLNEQKFQAEKSKAGKEFRKGNISQDIYQNMILKNLQKLNTLYHLKKNDINYHYDSQIGKFLGKEGTMAFQNLMVAKKIIREP